MLEATMSRSFGINESILKSVVGGKSAIDLPRLQIHTPDEASAFLAAYGFDLTLVEDQKKLWYFHRRALVFLSERLGFDLQEIPEVLREPKQLGDIRQLLLLASSTRSAEDSLQRWSCALLRVMHVFVHTENDLFSSFTEEIQKQILGPFQRCLIHEGSTAQSILRSANPHTPALPLLAFEIKPFKTSSSTVIKLLAKADALAMSVYDRLGVRFVTHSMWDAYRVVRFLIEDNLVSFPHIMPDQSSNNIYPVDLFLEVAREIQEQQRNYSAQELDAIFRERLELRKEKVEFLRKENNFSGTDYRFIKFIARKLIRIPSADGQSSFSFFFPFEVQIMDQSSHQKILSGPSQHQAYKERQRLAARQRVMPLDTDNSDIEKS